MSFRHRKRFIGIDASWIQCHFRRFPKTGRACLFCRAAINPGEHPACRSPPLRDQDATMRAVEEMNDPRVNEEQPADANAR